MTAPGQESGHAGLDWAGYLDALIGERGSLAALAEHLAAQRGHEDDLTTIERGLRRLRGRGNRDGGVWGRRVIAAFGLPQPIIHRVDWMGLYHSRFTDLPTSICRELLLPWDRPPVSESPARAYVQLGLGSVALRLREHERAAEHLEQAARAAVGDALVAARVEHALMLSYLVSREHSAQSAHWLDEAEAILESATGIHAADAACFYARLIDQRAYRLNKPRAGEGRPDHAAALALYARIPEDGPPFARCRRHNGMGWSALRLGRRQEALRHARASVQEAGDGGSLRLRAMALQLLASALTDADEVDEAAAAERRSVAIARRLEDEELMSRYGR